MRYSKYLAVPFLGVAVLSVAACGTEQEAADTTTPHIAVCGGDKQESPVSFNVGCDGSYSFSNVTWKLWSSDEATGVGQLASKVCEPSCAKGTVKKENEVTVTLSNPDENGKFTTATFNGNMLELP